MKKASLFFRLTTMSVKLSTADDPPKSIEVSRAFLAARSTVFNDMLSFPGRDEPVPVAETEAELKVFLLILENTASEDVLASLDREG